MDKRPIGVFDSGFGGLTVLEELVKALPNEDFIYFGDTLRVPYGNKTVEEIKLYSSQISRWLAQHDVKSIVVACNTVSCMALPYLKETFDVPFFGMADAGVSSVLEFSSGKTVSRIGIIGTKNTISSKVHEIALQSVGFNGTIVPLACPLFVPIIEEGVTDSSVWETIIEFHLRQMKDDGVDGILLACTHYPILTKYFQDYFGEAVALLNPNHFIADSLKEYLSERGLLNDGAGTVSLYVTGSTLSFNAFCHRFFEFNSDTVSVINIDTFL